MFVSPALSESTEVGSCPPMKGEMHRGGKLSGGGFGWGAQQLRFSEPTGAVLD